MLKIYGYEKDQKYLYLVRTIKDINYKDYPLGILIMQISSTVFSDVFQSNDRQFYVVDHEGAIFYSNDLQNPKTMESDIRDNMSDANGYFLREENGKRKLYTYMKFEECDWVLIQATDYEMIRDNAKPLINRGISLVIIMLGLSLMLYVVYAKHILKPVKELKNEMSKFGQGDMTAKVEIKSNDEIGF